MRRALSVVLLILLAPAGASAESTGKLRFATGVDLAYPMGFFLGASAGGSWRFLTADVAYHSAPGAHNDCFGVNAVVGARHDFLGPALGEAGWSLGVAASGGYRYYTNEVSETMTSGIHAIVASAGLEAVRWNASGFGLELRLAAVLTIPQAWDHDDFLYRKTGPEEGGELSVGLVRRW